MAYIWWLGFAVGVVLQVLVITALVRGGQEGFRFLLVYLTVLFLVTVLSATALYSPAAQVRAARWYWLLDALLQALILLVVLSLTHSALGPRENKTSLGRMLWVGAGLFVLASLYFTWDPRIGYWMTAVSRNLGFLAVVLNLVLWAVLIQFQRSNRVLLMVTGGMGIQMAGKAIGHALRQLAKTTELPGNLIIVLSHLLCLYIWWQALRRHGPSTSHEPHATKSSLS